MAYTASTGFRFHRSMSATKSDPEPIRFLLANSTTIRIGDLVRINTSGLATGAGVGNAVLGVVLGIVDKNGINPFGLGYTGASGGSLTGDDQIATASDNTTRANGLYVEVDPDPDGVLLWLNDADGDLAQTNLLQLFDVDSNNRQVTQSTASDTSGQLQLVLLDPEATGGKTADASKGVFRIAERQMLNHIGNSTAVITA